MEGQSENTIQKEIFKGLYSKQRILERDIDVDEYTQARLAGYQKIIDYCKSQASESVNNQEFIDTKLVDNKFNIVINDIQEMTGLYRQKDGSVVIGKSHGTHQEIMTRLVVLGVLKEMPTFEKSDSFDKDAVRDYVDYQNDDTYDLIINFNVPNNEGFVRKICRVKINRNFNLSEVDQNLSAIKSDHVNQLTDFRKKYGKIKYDSVTYDSGKERVYFYGPIHTAIKEIDRRKQ